MPVFSAIHTLVIAPSLLIPSLTGASPSACEDPELRTTTANIASKKRFIEILISSFAADPLQLMCGIDTIVKSKKRATAPRASGW
jgi:hypothetical protein